VRAHAHTEHYSCLGAMQRRNDMWQTSA
jgi:hypothetical protein